jgi:hypothetical protein
MRQFDEEIGMREGERDEREKGCDSVCGESERVSERVSERKGRELKRA